MQWARFAAYPYVAKAVVAALVGAGLMLASPLVSSSLEIVDHRLTEAERLALIRRAHVWVAADVAAMDIRTGPGQHEFAPNALVQCDFSPKEFGGRTPKFGCAIGSGDVRKVRYGRANGEVYASVAATRLLWALGFGADTMYPVRVLCRDCPSSLEGAGVTTPGGIRFDVAAIEHKFPGHEIGNWSWSEFQLIDSAAGGATLAERDALRLLAVVLQHSDNKPEQQRLVCRNWNRDHDTPEACDPFLIIHDVGETFGRANLFNRSSVGSVNFERWSTTPIWKDPAGCIGTLARSKTGTLSNPIISEAGRALLSSLLAQLTDQQLTDLFSVARFADRPHGGAPVAAWVAAFKHKRDEVTSAHCPT